MSRNIPDRSKAKYTYDAAQTLKKVAFIGQRSLFLSDAVELWTPEHFEPLMTNYVGNLIEGDDDSRGKTFWEKLPHQVGHCPPMSVALFAEIYWTLVFPSSLLKASKLTRLKDILAIAKGKLPEFDLTSPLLSKDTLAGVGSTGAAYNMLLWSELAYAIRLFKDLADKNVDEREKLLDDPWAFARWMVEHDTTKSRQLYHILCHVLFPDYFERVFSEGGKSALARNPLLAVPRHVRDDRPERDKALLAARQRLEQEYPDQVIDYYHFPPLLVTDKDTPPKKRGRPPKALPPTSTSLVEFMEDDPEPGEEFEQSEDGAEAKPWRPRNRIYFGPPGSGKTRAMEILRARRYRAGERVVFVSFHPSYSYEDFVEGYRPEPGQGGRLGERPSPGPFRDICESAHKSPDLRHTLFIDEINRANVAKVFGELITLLEPSKRCDPTPTLDFSGVRSSARLQYSGDLLAIPANLDIIASMNTADRSVQAIDRALRRRFEFVETPANPQALPEAKLDGVDLRALLAAINDRIEFLLDSDHAIGHALLMGCRNLWDLRRVFSHRVIPLLQEYFFEDLHKAKLALTGSSRRSAFFEERRLDVSRLFDSSAELDTQETRISIRPSTDLAAWTAADFLGLYLRGDELEAAIAALPPAVSAGVEEGAEEEFEDINELEDLEEFEATALVAQGGQSFVQRLANEERQPVVVMEAEAARGEGEGRSGRIA